jgi:formate hydrogenlyase subunit 4
MEIIIIIIAYIILVPIVCGTLAGLDRKITARMQARVGPPIAQPFYDVFKLMQKESIVVRKSQNLYILFFLLTLLFTGSLFFTGENILLVIFALTLAEIFFVLGAYKTSSPYSFIGSQRELIQMMAYEPVLILTGIGVYMVTKSFYIRDIVALKKPLIVYLPGLFFAFFYILAMKFRKSPFDLSMSEHAHQELVRGITTEFSAKALGMIQVAHWYDQSIMLGFIYLFFMHNVILGLMAVLAVYFLIIIIDNTFARLRWQLALSSCWIVALISGVGNIIVLFFLK